VLRRFGDAVTAETIGGLALAIEGVETIDELSQLEASAAALYFGAWSGRAECSRRVGGHIEDDHPSRCAGSRVRIHQDRDRLEADRRAEGPRHRGRRSDGGRGRAAKEAGESGAGGERAGGLVAQGG